MPGAHLPPALEEVSRRDESCVGAPTLFSVVRSADATVLGLVVIEPDSGFVEWDAPQVLYSVDRAALGGSDGVRTSGNYTRSSMVTTDITAHRTHFLPGLP